MAIKINKLLAYSTLLTSLSFNVNAKEYSTNTAQLQAMDKITGRVNVIKAPVNSEVKFGSFSIIVRDCKTRPPEETPENFAFIDVADYDDNTKTQMNIFKGWMISSSPSLNAVEHPIYDIWLLKCIDTEVNKTKLLTPEQLKDRDGLPKLRNQEKDNKFKDISDLENLLDVNQKIEEEQKALEKLDEPPAVIEETVIEETTIQEPASVNGEILELPQTPENGQGPQSLFNFGNESQLETVEPAADSVAEPLPNVSPIIEEAETISIEDADLKTKEEDAAKAINQVEEIEETGITESNEEDISPSFDTSPLIPEASPDDSNQIDNSDILDLLNKD